MKLYDELRQHNPLGIVTPNKGNWGDNLIRMGAEKMIKEMRHEKIMPPDTTCEAYYIHGVGGIGNTYKSVASKASELRKDHPKSKIIFGPTTAMTSPEDFPRLIIEFADVLGDKNFVFYARELMTFKFMKQFDFEVRLDECPSFYLNKSDLPEVEEKYDKILILRDDPWERIDKVELEADVSKIIDPADQAESFEKYVQAHGAKHIYTNRLHSAILGTILGKKVTMFRNNYHKNRSVWEYSLRKRGVNWLDV